MGCSMWCVNPYSGSFRNISSWTELCHGLELSLKAELGSRDESAGVFNINTNVTVRHTCYITEKTTLITVVPHLFVGYMFHDLQWIPESKDCIEPYIYYAFFLYKYTYDKV